MSDSCGYIVLDHGTNGGKGRIIVAFRGTYSLANTIVDLSTVPQEYVPYPEDPDEDTNVPTNHRKSSWKDWIPWPLKRRDVVANVDTTLKRTIEPKCRNCTVHSGFWTSWKNTRPYVVPHLNVLHQKYPHYELDLVGHSLGGAVAALASLELKGNLWRGRTTVTTFGEPQIGNNGLRDYLDAVFNLQGEGQDLGDARRYRRVTHVDDPVPLLPLQEWGYESHAGEVYITKPELQPEVQDIRLCYSDADENCIAGSDGDGVWSQNLLQGEVIMDLKDGDANGDEMEALRKRWGLPIPTRYKLWQLFFAHRDYFWRLGLCLPGSDPWDWNRPHYNISGGHTNGEL